MGGRGGERKGRGVEREGGWERKERGVIEYGDWGERKRGEGKRRGGGELGYLWQHHPRNCDRPLCPLYTWMSLCICTV